MKISDYSKKIDYNTTIVVGNLKGFYVKQHWLWVKYKHMPVYQLERRLTNNKIKHNLE